MKQTDLKPTRIGLTIELLKKFVIQFLEKNPLAQMALSISEDGLCKSLEGFSSQSDKFITSLATLLPKYEKFSLQASLEQAIIDFDQTPLYAFKEILIIQSSASTIDQGNIFTTLEKIQKCKFTVNVISLNAQTFIFKKVCTQTNGQYETVLNESNYQEVLNKYLKPPSYDENCIARFLVKVAFPSLKKLNQQVLCMCHNSYSQECYQCPVCLSYICRIP